MLGLGEGLALLSGFGYAAANVAIAKSAQGGRGGDNGALLSIVFTASAALAVFALGGLVQGYSARYDSLPGLAWYVLSGLLTIVVGRALFFQSVAHIGAIRASAVNRLNPFFSVILAAILLGEAIKSLAGIGMLLIALSFVILIRRLLLRHRTAQAATPDLPGQSRPLSLMAYSFGTASALAYALGYIARKFGLTHIPDSNFGTFVGAAAGIAAYLAMALFVNRYRAALRGLWSETTRWHLMAASFISVGQLAQFAAIKYIEVSRVVMLTSVEVFISMFLSIYVLRTEPRPDLPTIAAAIVAAVGVILISLG